MKISVITVSFNSADTIEDTIKSVENQTYRDTEHLIIDGGSDDDTRDVVLRNKSINLFISEPDDGLYDAMNKGLRNASGDIIAIVNSDDLLLDRYVLQKVAETFNRLPDVDILCGGVILVDKHDLRRKLRSYQSSLFRPWMLRFGIAPPHPGVFVRRSCYNKIGGYKTELSIAADFEFLVRAFLVHKIKFRLDKNVFTLMRNGGKSNQGIKSMIKGTVEIKSSLGQNGIYSNYLMLTLRMPYKFLTQVFLFFLYGR